MKPCKKTLLFHFFIQDDYYENEMYKFHYECLKKYAHIFDEAIFYLTIDNLNDKEKINDVKHKLIDCGFKDIFFNVRENTPYCEVATFKEEIIDKGWDKNGMVFFMHTKGTWDMRKFNIPKENIFKWAYALYFYSLEFVDEAEKSLIMSFVNIGGCDTYFFGSVRMYNEDIPSFHYSGTAYWFNPKSIKCAIKNNEINEPIIRNRIFVEDFPRLFSSAYPSIRAYSHNNAYIVEGTFDAYWNDWDLALDIYGDKELYYEGYNEIMNKIQ